jgi:hypothetical protein
MSIRQTAKNAVKTAKRSVSSLFLSATYKEYSNEYTPGSITRGAVILTDSFTVFDIAYDKTLSEVLPFVRGERYVGVDPDEIAVQLEENGSLEITEQDGQVYYYTISGLARVQQDVLFLLRLKPGG